MKKYLSFAAFMLLMSATTLSLCACGGDDDDDVAPETNGGGDNVKDAAVLAGICPDNNHPHAIDMGEAGIWACCNVGADKPEEYGDYFAWGETESKDDYSWANYPYKDGKVLGYDIGGSSTYDAATKNMGSQWRTPSIEQMSKLKDNCTSEWIDIIYIYGRLFTAPNGNKIFLPAAGRHVGTQPNYEGSSGCYMSSSLNASHTTYAWGLAFDLNDAETSVSFNIKDGCTVRPVRR